MAVHTEHVLVAALLFESPGALCKWLFGASHARLQHAETGASCPVELRCGDTFAARLLAPDLKYKHLHASHLDVFFSSEPALVQLNAQCSSARARAAGARARRVAVYFGSRA